VTSSSAFDLDQTDASPHAIVGHGGARQMPQFVLSPGEIDDRLAYLMSLETG
jgi:hypothetical protein